MVSHSRPRTTDDTSTRSIGVTISADEAPPLPSLSDRSPREDADPNRYVPVVADPAKGTLEGTYNAQAAAERATRARIRRLLGQ